MNKVLSLFIFLLISTQIFAQASASATVESRATIIDPIKIDKTVDLDFGNVISAYNPGTVILTPDGSRVAYGVQISYFLSRYCKSCSGRGYSWKQ